MHATVSVEDIVLRLLAATAAGAVIGFDRGRRGRTAGLRTAILLCLAAAGAMIEANLILSVTGKGESSFVRMDVLRFPLGILSGIGFIGAGAILKKGSMVTGVTTAATLWLVTVIGLVLGGGYFLLGGALVVLAVLVLVLLVLVEPMIARDHNAGLTVEVAEDGPSTEELRALIAAEYKIASFTISHARKRLIHCTVRWRSAEGAVDEPPLVRRLARADGVISVLWEPLDSGQHD